MSETPTTSQICPICLETRTEESDVRASLWVKETLGHNESERRRDPGGSPSLRLIVDAPTTMSRSSCGVHQGSVLSPLVFAIMVDVVMESVRNGLMSEMLYADDLVLISETMEGLREKFWKWKEAFESKGLKVNLGKTKVVVSGAVSEVSVSKVDPCGICGKQVMANSVLCVKCRK